MTWEDEFGPTLRKALDDPEFAAEYTALCDRHAREYLSLRPSGRLRSWLRWRFSSWERFGWWLADMDHWAGWTNDEVTVTSATGWLSLHWVQLYAWRGEKHRHPHLDSSILACWSLPFKIKIEVAAMWR